MTEQAQREADRLAELEEQIEQEYHEAARKLDEFIRKNDARIVRNLLQQYLVGVFDVGVTESLTAEQTKGVTIWLEDMLLTAEHLDLTEGIEQGEAPDWR